MDWPAWMDRWDRQQEGYLPNREARFDVLVSALAHTSGDEPNVLDLCCGPGSLSARVLARLPRARLVALDADPALQLLGRKVYGDAGGRLTWIEHDLADPTWERAAAAHAPYDAVVSTTALHWLASGTLAAVYEAVWRLLSPGGAFIDGDHLFEPETHPRLRQLRRALRARADEPSEEYGPWWAAYQAESAHDADLRAAFDVRAAEGTGHPESEAVPGIDFHRAALVHAGFAEVGTVWQHGDDRLLVAFRP